jgi:hypothetical protein
MTYLTKTCLDCNESYSVFHTHRCPSPTSWQNQLTHNEVAREGTHTKPCMYCRTEIDRQASVCPQCHKKQPKSKALALVCLGAVGFLALVGAGSNTNVNNINNRPAYTDQAQAELDRRNSGQPMSTTTAPAPSPAPAKLTFEEWVKTATNAVYKHCEQKWGSEFDMQVYCRTNQMKAMHWFIAETKWMEESPDQVVKEKIMTTCVGKWDIEFDMVKYCYENQVRAYKKLQR